MSIGAKSALDKKLVEIYKNTQTICADTKSRIDPTKIMDNMQMIAINNQAYIFINNTAKCK
ncbi:MAG: hypothetical protein WC197_08410 [Candidatus Gastranaerophilaceae bacterium]|jgi:hypothetical protein